MALPLNQGAERWGVCTCGAIPDLARSVCKHVPDALSLPICCICSLYLQALWQYTEGLAEITAATVCG